MTTERRYRVALRVLDLLVTEVDALDEDEARSTAPLRLAYCCAQGEESTVKVEAVAEVVLDG